MPKFRALALFAQLAACQVVIIVYYLLYLNDDNPILVSAINYGELLGWTLLSLLPAQFLEKDLSRPSAVVLWYFYLVIILPLGPLSVLTQQQVTVPTAFISLALPFLCISLLHRTLRPAGKVQLNLVNVRDAALGMLLLTLGGALLLWLFVRPTFNFDLFLVYDRRFEAREIAAQGSLLAYAVSIWSSVIAPLTIALSFAGKFRWTYFIGGIVAMVVMFSFDGTKQSLVTPVAMLTICALVRYRLLSPATLAYGLIGLLLGGMLIESLLESDVFTVLVVRRLILVPVNVFHGYLSFFRGDNFIQFSDIRGLNLLLNSSERNVTANYLIGEEHFGMTGLNANVGAIQYGYAEYGITGCFIYAFLLLGYLVVLDMASRNKSPLWIMPLAFFIAQRCTEQSFHTSLLSGGIGMLLVALIVIFEPKKALASGQVAPTRSDGNWRGLLLGKATLGTKGGH